MVTVGSERPTSSRDSGSHGSRDKRKSEQEKDREKERQRQLEKERKEQADRERKEKERREMEQKERLKREKEQKDSLKRDKERKERERKEKERGSQGYVQQPIRVGYERETPYSSQSRLGRSSRSDDDHEVYVCVRLRVRMHVLMLNYVLQLFLSIIE